VRRVEERPIEHLKSDPLADRILAGEIPIGERLIHDRHLAARQTSPVKSAPRTRRSPSTSK
jgi:hypothetical protein